MNDEQLLRYSRHIFLPEIDVAGQEKLLQSTVLLIGVGGLGSAVALYLAASGVGKLMIADRETVDLSNLQRQIIHNTTSIDKQKTQSAKDAIQALNPDVEVIIIDDLDEKNIKDYVKKADCVIDGSDNFKTRFAINYACHDTKTPLISGAAIQFSGQLAVFDFAKNQSPCYQCLFTENATEENRCQDSGVISPLVGVIGSLQALEAIKLLIGLPTQQQLLQFNAITNAFRTSTITPDPACIVCKEC